MHVYIVYFLIAIGATTIGALTGMGGGVIIKPLCDIMGHYDPQTIGVLSCVTVFAMALVSLAKQIRQKANLEFTISLPLSIGSVAGGMFGQRILEWIAADALDSCITMIQNIVLAVIIGVVFWYMLHKEKIPKLHLKGLAASVLSGGGLGFISSFLGIGGGPINVALIIFLFSVSTKTATICSIFTILFAQVAKLGTIAAGGGFAGYDLSVMPVMIAGAVLGGFIGAKLNKELDEKSIERSFNAVQLLVLSMCVLNIVRNL